MDFVFKGWSFERGADGSVSIRTSVDVDLYDDERLRKLSLREMVDLLSELHRELTGGGSSVRFEPEEWADIVAAVSRAGMSAVPAALALHVSGHRPR